jgi:hypothetical protein
MMTGKTGLPPEAEEVLDEVEEKQKKDKERIADKLIKIAIEKSYHDDDSRPNAGGLFHTSDRVAYADLEVFGWRETWPIRSRGFRHWLVRIYYETTGMAPNSEALQTALALCEARAFFDGPERRVFTRVGGAGGKVYIDLANEHWQAIEISSTGWRVLDSKQVPVRFRRAPGMLPLPEPCAGGSVEDLRSFLNVKSDDDFELALAWLLAAMRDRGPYPVLALMGEQGSAKTSFATILRSLVDPNTAALRSFPREDRDLFIAASNGWIVGYDNVSRIPSWLSDALCRLATGGGFSTRKLYTDDEEQLFNAQRPSVLNGIEDFVNRPDLADRTIFLTLDPIPEDKRKADQALQDEFNRVQPKILGTLLNLTVIGLQRLPRTQLARLPRMADFALWGTACEREPGAFMKAYEANRSAAVDIILEADLVATAVQSLMAQRKEWAGTASQLLAALEGIAGERVAKSKYWPSSPEVLGRSLRRPATFLRKVGIEITFNREGRTRKILITRTTPPDWVGKQPSQPSQPSQPKKANSLGGDSNGDGRRAELSHDLSPGDGDSNGDRWGAKPSPEPSPSNPLLSLDNDSSDGSDSEIRTQSAKPPDDEPVCRRCGVPGNATHGQLIRAGRDGAVGHYHPRCWTEERTKGPLRKPAMGHIIRVTDSRTGNKLDLCRVAANPEPVAEAARRQTYKIGKKESRLYSAVEIVGVEDRRPALGPEGDSLEDLK